MFTNEVALPDKMKARYFFLGSICLLIISCRPVFMYDNVNAKKRRFDCTYYDSLNRKKEEKSLSFHISAKLFISPIIQMDRWKVKRKSK